MAKSKRAAADRKKIEALTLSKSAEVSDCGTIFTAVGDAALTLTLPTIGTAGNGWWCKVIKVGAHSGGQDITVAALADDGGSCILCIEASQACEAITGDDMVIENRAGAGSGIEVVCDGTQWLALATGFNQSGGGSSGDAFTDS